MAYEPQFTISARLLSLVEDIAALRERIQGAAVELSWIPALQKDSRTRNVHASTAIEGNPLTLEQVRALEEGRELAASDARSSREVLNYFAARASFSSPTGTSSPTKPTMRSVNHSEMNVIHVLSQWPGYRFRSDEPKFLIGKAIGS